MNLVGCIDRRPVVVAFGKGGGAAARRIRAGLPSVDAPSLRAGHIGKSGFFDYLPPDADRKSGKPPAPLLAGIAEHTRLTGWTTSIAAGQSARPAAGPTVGAS